MTSNDLKQELQELSESFQEWQTLQSESMAEAAALEAKIASLTEDLKACQAKDDACNGPLMSLAAEMAELEIMIQAREAKEAREAEEAKEAEEARQASVLAQIAEHEARAAQLRASLITEVPAALTEVPAALTEVPAISVAGVTGFQANGGNREGPNVKKLKNDLSEFVYPDGRLWVGFSYEGPLKNSGLYNTNLKTFFEEYESPKKEMIITRGISHAAAAGISKGYEIFNTVGSIFIRKIAPSLGGGIDLCEIVEPYHFVPDNGEEKMVNRYQHRAVYRRIRLLTDAEKAAVESAHNNNMRQQIVSVRLAI